MKIRSWNEALNKFLYFEDGRYFTETISMFEDNYHLFNWQNKEDYIMTLKDIDIYVGDRISFEHVVSGKTLGSGKVIPTRRFKDEGVIILVKGQPCISNCYLTSLMEFIEPIELIGDIHESWEGQENG